MAASSSFWVSFVMRLSMNPLVVPDRAAEFMCRAWHQPQEDRWQGNRTDTAASEVETNCRSGEGLEREP